MTDKDPDILTQKKCLPCEVGTRPMDHTRAESFLSRLSGWELKDQVKIRKEFAFDAFGAAIAFVNKVAAIAEKEGHHPSIFISYNKVRITLSTHAIGGLSENDFIMAAKIDSINV